MSTSVTSASHLRWYQAIDRKLWIILAITYLGWLLDSMDLNLFTVVLVPSLRELLGPQAGPQMIGYYGGAIAAVQLLGWGVGGLIFGILGEQHAADLEMEMIKRGMIFEVINWSQGQAELPL